MVRNLSVIEPSVERWEPNIVINTFQTIISLIIVIGNGTLLVFIIKSKFKLMKPNLFILSLTISDLLTGLIGTPFGHYVSHFDTSQLFCDIYLGIAQLFARASSITIMIISIDRYMKLSHPIKYKTCWSSTKRRIGIIIMTWTISASFSVIKFLDSITNSGNYTKGCFYRSAYSSFEQVELVITIFGANIVALVIYLKILVLVRIPSQQRFNLTEHKVAMKKSKLCIDCIKNGSRNSEQSHGNIEHNHTNIEHNDFHIKHSDDQAIGDSMMKSNSTDAKTDSFQGVMIPKVEPLASSNNLRRHLGNYTPIQVSVKCHSHRPSFILGLIVILNLIFVSFPPIVYSIFIICESCAVEDIMHSIPWIFWMSCAVNPIIFALLNNDYRSHILSYFPNCSIRH